MAAAYWIAKGLTVDEPIERVRRVRPTAIETDDQKTLLRQFAASTNRYPTEQSGDPLA